MDAIPSIYIYVGIGFIAYILFSILLLASRLRTCSEDERFAIFLQGKFKGLRGPGRMFHWPLIMDMIVIKKGDEGELVSDSEANIKDILLPVRIKGSGSPGAKLKIVQFEADYGGQRVVVEVW